MSSDPACWYLAVKGEKPNGPFSQEHLVEACRTGQLDGALLCWREGITQWLPLAQVEPFASALASGSAPPLPPPVVVPQAGVPPALSARSWRSASRRVSSAWIGWTVAAGILAVGIVLLLTVKPPSGAVDRSPRLDLSDFERTRAWALQQHWELAGIEQQGNAIRLADARRDLEQKLQEQVGKEVSWRIAVTGVNDRHVVLEDHWTRKGEGRVLASSECYLAMGCGQDPVADTAGEISMMLSGRAPIMLNMGQQISRSEAAQLNRGDTVVLQAFIEKITVSGQCILIRLSEAQRLSQEPSPKRADTRRKTPQKEAAGTRVPPPAARAAPFAVPAAAPPFFEPKAQATPAAPAAAPAPSLAPASPRVGLAEPGGATSRGPSAPPLENGVVIGDFLGVAVAKVDRVRGRPTHSIPLPTSECLEVTLLFRLLRRHWPGPDFQVLVRDDRGNRYESSLFSLGAVSTRAFYYMSSTLKGVPPCVEQLPPGFTWSGKVRVEMPHAAPIAEMELSVRLDGSDQGRRTLLPFNHPAVPSFDSATAPERFLNPGTRLKQDANLEAEIGRLTIVGTGTAKRGQHGVAASPLLSLPITVTNSDYSAHESAAFHLFVQSEHGEVSEHLMTQWQTVPGKSTKALALDYEEPAERTWARDRSVDFSNRMMTPAIAELGGIRTILLYRNSHQNTNFPPDFLGFIPIPDDVRQHFGGAASKTSAAVTAGSTALRPSDPNLGAPAANSLSGNWKASAGALFRIEDDGTTAKVELVSSDSLQAFSGELMRRDDKEDSKSLTGTVKVAFRHVPGKRSSVRVTLVVDDVDHLRLRCGGWPQWDNRGRNIGEKILNEIWTRQKGRE